MPVDESGRPPLSVAILAGGQSRRMGRDKAMLSLWPGGPPLLQLVVDIVAPLADDVFVVASGRPAYADFGVRVVPDAYPDAATLGGIATAIEAARTDATLVVACDMPMLSASLIRHLRDIPREYDVLVPVLAGESRQGGRLVRQTLHAIYRPACLPPIRERIVAGRLQVIGFFPEVRVREVPEDEVRRFDPDLRSFHNANTPEAAAVAAAWLRRQEPGRRGNLSAPDASSLSES